MNRENEIPRKFVMCPPSFYEVEYSINPMTKESLTNEKEVDTKKALKSWIDIYFEYLEAGAEVEIVPPRRSCSELTFFGDLIFVWGNQAILSNPRNAERAPEVKAAKNWAEKKASIYTACQRK